MRQLAGPQAPTTFAFVATEDEQLVAPFIRLLELVDVSEVLLDKCSGRRSAFRHRDMTTLGTRTLHTILRHGGTLF
jgi:hypothetical protein